MENRQVVFSRIQAGISQISSQIPPQKCSWDGSEHPGGAQEFFCPVPHKYPGVNADYRGVIPQS